MRCGTRDDEDPEVGELARAAEYGLADLLEKVTARNIHSEVEAGRAVGREIL